MSVAAHIRAMSDAIQAARDASTPTLKGDDDWDDAAVLAGKHNLPAVEVPKRMSVARCARVSYLNHNGTRDMERDLEHFSAHFRALRVPKSRTFRALLREQSRFLIPQKPALTWAFTGWAIVVSNH